MHSLSSLFAGRNGLLTFALLLVVASAGIWLTCQPSPTFLQIYAEEIPIVSAMTASAYYIFFVKRAFGAKTPSNGFTTLALMIVAFLIPVNILRNINKPIINAENSFWMEMTIIVMGSAIQYIRMYGLLRLWPPKDVLKE